MPATTVSSNSTQPGTNAKPSTMLQRVSHVLRKETTGGVLLVAAAVIALVWANSPAAESYFALRNFEIGYEPWHLRLPLGAWAADGLLAIFFFLVGLELKREFIVGSLRDLRTSIVPIVAAAGGVAVPALIYIAVVHSHSQLHQGWAIPTATDIAFAVAVLAIIGSHLPPALRIFLLTLAVVDDLIAVTIIAVFYTDHIEFVPLLIGLAVIGLYGVIAHRFRDFFSHRSVGAWAVLLPLGLIAWALVHASGIHATVAGVLLGFAVPVRYSNSAPGARTDIPGLAEIFDFRFRPFSAGIAVPVFAFFAAGVNFGGLAGLGSSLTHPVTIAVIAGLVFGKPLGILITTWLMTTFTRSKLDRSITWIDLTGIGLLAGIGFTVSLLVAELSFSADLPEHDEAKVAILLASVLASILASILLVARNRRYRRLASL